MGPGGAGLGLRGAGPDGAPGEEVRQELGADRVQELAAAGQAELVDLQQQLPGDAQPCGAGRSCGSHGRVCDMCDLVGDAQDRKY